MPTAIENLKALGFTTEQMTCIVAHHDASRYWALSQDSAAALREIDFTAEHIVRI